MPTLTALTRDPVARLIHLTLDDGTRAQLTYRQAAQLGFWLKVGQRLELTGEFRAGILYIATRRILADVLAVSAKPELQ